MFIDWLITHDNFVQKVFDPFISCRCPCSLHHIIWFNFAYFTPSPVSGTNPTPIPVPSPVPAPTLVHQRPILNIWFLPIVHSSISAIRPVTPAPLSLALILNYNTKHIRAIPSKTVQITFILNDIQSYAVNTEMRTIDAVKRGGLLGSDVRQGL